ncbi:MAG: hypothetical protein M0042_13380 [Nitrospiraceae bacterium]|nr:hypothetical protein [Nitrospiraceae bacterium]
MRTGLSIIIAAAGLLLTPPAAWTADSGTMTAQAGQAPAPVAQPLVREGEFALKLAAMLDLGTPTEEAVAEDTLAKAGVAPLNGWLSDYPMTPQIVGQLDDAISKAAGQGRIPMNSQQAIKGLYTLTAQFNLPTPASMAPARKEPAAQAPQVARPVVNNYYYNQGPPVITYYPPPPDYVYLYDWVPYPVWWFDVWWPGFYICHDFTTIVVVQQRPVVVTNHVVDPETRRVAYVDPVGRRTAVTGAPVRPVTVLRTDNGASYRTVSDFRGTGRMSSSAIAPVERRGPGFSTPSARTGAEHIYSRIMTDQNAAGMRSMPERRSAPMVMPSERAMEKPASPQADNSFRSFGGQQQSFSRGGEGRTSLYTPPPGAQREHGFESGRPFSYPGTSPGNERRISPMSQSQTFGGYSGMRGGYEGAPGGGYANRRQGKTEMGHSTPGGFCRGNC